jgi:hypothetical protein
MTKNLPEKGGFLFLKKILSRKIIAMKIIAKKPLTFGDKGDSITLVKDCLRGGNKTPCFGFS